MTRMQKRIVMAILGVLICGVSVAVMRMANMGTDPYTVFMLGLAGQFHSDYSTIYPIATGLLLVVTFFLDRKFIGIATAVSLFLTGYACDFALWVMKAAGIQPTTLAQQLALLVAGLALTCVGASLYFTADLGVSGYDAMALIAAKRKVSSLRVCRVTTDVLCVVAGWALGSTVGVGTVLTALCMGPVIQWLNHALSEPMLAHCRPDKVRSHA